MDKRPKRRKYKDNPYTLDKDSNNNTYFIKFYNSKNEIEIIEVSSKVYEVFDKYELIDLSQMNEYDNHIEHLDLDEDTLYKRMKFKNKSVSEEVEEKIVNESLKTAIDSLTKTQKRRIKLYYFEDMNYREIAEIEKCSIASVKESIDSGIVILEKKLKNLK